MRLIDAERLDVFAAKCPDGRDVYSFMDGVTAVLDEVDKLPVINLVRCEECNKSKEWPNGRWCSLFRASVNTDSYCSFGAKRKEGREKE